MAHSAVRNASGPPRSGKLRVSGQKFVPALQDRHATIKRRVLTQPPEKGDIGRIHCSVNGLARWHDRSTPVSGHRLEQAAEPTERTKPYQLKEWSETDRQAPDLTGQLRKS
jgi:hypothetical protein